MKKWTILLVLLLMATDLQAREVAGVDVEETAVVGERTLQLNGCGIRTKFFMDIYVGSLYTERQIASLAEAVGDPGAKLIRMTFVYKKVDREKIVDAFSEGLSDNSPGLAGSDEAQKFLSLFRNDFLEGDTVDLEFGTGGSLEVRHNDEILGRLFSPPLSRGVLAIYLGDEPADEDLREGMLGLNL